MLNNNLLSKQTFIILIMIVLNTYSTNAPVDNSIQLCFSTIKNESNHHKEKCDKISKSSYIIKIVGSFGIKPCEICYVASVCILESLFRLASYKYSQEKLYIIGFDFATLIVLMLFAFSISLIINTNIIIKKILTCSLCALFIKAVIDFTDDISQIQKMTLQILFGTLFLIATIKF